MMAEQELSATSDHEGTTTVLSTSAAQRLRKRELDRKAQRTARMKTKNRIAHLESIVDSFRHRDENGTATALTKQLEQAREERDGLLRVLANVQSSISPHLKTPDTSSTSQVKPRSRQGSSHTTKGATDSPETQPQTEHEAPLGSLDWNSVGAAASNVTNKAHQEAVGWSDIHCNMPIPTSNITFNNAAGSGILYGSLLGPSCDCSTARLRALPDGTLVKSNIWRAANDILCEPDPVSDSEPYPSHEASHDIAVRAILEGWDSVERSHQLGPVWRKVRKLDQLGFSICSQTERLGMLWMVHLAMTTRKRPGSKNTPPLPQCYLELSSHHPPHSQAIDYFVWPGVREQFIWSEHRYCRNMFWYLLSEHLRVLWPLDFRDCFYRDTETSQYRLNIRFENTIQRAESWTMEKEFFSYYPELVQAIPIFIALPLPVFGGSLS